MSRESVPAGRSSKGGSDDKSTNDRSQFLTDYYEHVAAEDLLNYSSDVLAKRALDHREVARRREPGQTAVGLRHEAESTVVEIVAEDVPYLLQSITAELTREEADIRLLVHPTFRVRRDPRTHELTDIVHGQPREGLSAGSAGAAPPGTDDGYVRELWISVEIGRLPDEASAERLASTLQGIVADVRIAAEDSAAIHQDVRAAADHLLAKHLKTGTGRTAGQAAEVRALLHWLDAGNFIFLGSCTFDAFAPGTVGGHAVPHPKPADASVTLVPRPGTARGLLRHLAASPASGPTPQVRLAHARGAAPELLSVTKSDIRSTVLRRTYLDEVSIRTLDVTGQIATERRFVGLFAHGSSSLSVLGVPVLREKVRAVLADASPAPGSHATGELLSALEALPHDELFQMDAVELSRLANEIQRVQARRRTRLFLRPVARGRFVSALLFLPRHRYSTAVRLRVEQVLRKEFNSNDVEFELRLAESAMARVFFRILLPEEGLPTDFDRPALERQVLGATRTWEEGIDEALRDRFPTDEALRLARLWAGAFPASYRADYEAEDAVRDIARFEAFDLDGPGQASTDDVFLKVYVGSELAPWRGEVARIRLYLTKPRSLTQILPYFHNLGLEVLDQRPYTLVRRSAAGTVGAGAVGLPGKGNGKRRDDGGLQGAALPDGATRQPMPGGATRQPMPDGATRQPTPDGATRREASVASTPRAVVEPLTSPVRELFLYDLGLHYPAGVDPLGTSTLLVDSFRAALRGDTESDRFDALVLTESLDWRQVVIMRGYAKYLRQLGTSNSYTFIADTLLDNVPATQALLDLFQARFDPRLSPSERLMQTNAARAAVTAAIDSVPSLDADRLLRTFLNLIEATTRTNFFRNRPFLSYKLRPSDIPGAPYPRPKFEIWVYSPRVEGVHLRFGPVARGGLRWSERREDFRTEILGLVKAQIVKNSVIVPTGAKGGFYPKRLPEPTSDRTAWFIEGAESYKDFIRGLLDITDNLDLSDTAGAGPDASARNGSAAPAPTPGARAVRGAGGRVIPPQDVVRHDDDDYYLVVAADKGTASFSDLANSVAKDYGFWLGDAFASGGSVGYDHKKMGITARGAWESVKHHFSELGIDTQRQDFTVVGIGDMSGDVFGNGMQLSEHIRLVAAFDHRHIFLDPAPDPAVSLEERRRLFSLARSSWADYSPELISPGGGVYPRLAKSVAISPQVRSVLALPTSTTAMSPPELIQAILRAPVDLIYNGGIGTYVKASTETHADVGDKANDAVRINGNELRARIVVEGGNLGVTQHGRVEAALNGVLLNTDAIDNSAGVDCSDHEVNIKIFVDRMIATGTMDASERADFLQSLSDEVARLVLKNNQDQNTLLLNDRALVVNWSPGFERTMDWLENACEFDRRLEGLPTTEELHERLQTGKGLMAPELSVLAAYAKIQLAKELNESDVTDDPWFGRVLRSYFPRQLVDRFGARLDGHPLRRQIICTVLANDIINLGGITFVFRTVEETTATAAAVARAFVAVREAYALQEFVDQVAELPADFPSQEAAQLTLHMRRVLDRATRWYVTHDHRDQPVAQALARIMPTMELLRYRTLEFMRGEHIDLVEERQAHWDSVGLPHELGRRASDMLESFGLLDISLISEQIDEPLEQIMDLYWTVFARIGAVKLLLRITALPRQNRWEALARAALRDDVYSAVADMTISVMQMTKGADTQGADSIERIVSWERGHQEQLVRIKDTFAEATRPGQEDIQSISVALKLLRSLVRN